MGSTVDVGYAKQKQYTSTGRRKHAVEKNEKGRWQTVCKETPATREYKGWVTTLTCQGCRKALGVEPE